MKSHQEEMEIVNLGVGEEKKEVKVGTSMTMPIQDALVALLRDYQDIFTWSYQDMPSLSPDIVQHRLPLNPSCSPVKQKLRRMKPKMSLLASWQSLDTQNGSLTLCRFPRTMEKCECAWTIRI